MPTFGDNTLTISHQFFIGAVTKVSEQVFGELKPVECRVSHAIIGRIPTTQLKKRMDYVKMRKLYFIKEWHL